ncbi:hypothetical protein PISL3812_09020 [Talaromyces islandicus]|uniref:Serine hydrolase domain-containing protein n=1 Tax=Talaromyces islandicus TaxID=28573 RepID=A0A0U1MAM1_TALIS|nr:hypothetical protein PISL3812_09020 [Talaromyces islandicus]
MAAPKIRVLCLHGHGSNSQAFEAETAALRHELGDEFEWIFAQAPVPMQPGQWSTLALLDEEIMRQPGKFYSPFDINDSTSLLKAQERLEEFVHQEGDFQLVVCESISASIVASLLQRRAEENPDAPPLFKGAVFLAGYSPLDRDAILNAGFDIFENRALSNTQSLPIPTANIWGSKDARHVDRSPLLAQLCNPSMNINFVHDADSMIPGAADEEALVGAAHAIQQTVDRAMCVY